MTTKVSEHQSGTAANSHADPAKAGKLAQQIVAILINEDSVTRHRAVHAAMTLLGEAAPQQNQFRAAEGDSGGDADLATFFNREGSMKPADHAQLCAAYHYSIYGVDTFSIAELRAIAADAGVVLPDRVDMTLRNAVHKGKKLFQPAGSGAFRPTTAAGVHFAEKWKARPGKNAKPSPTKGEFSAEDR